MVVFLDYPCPSPVSPNVDFNSSQDSIVRAVIVALLVGFFSAGGDGVVE